MQFSAGLPLKLHHPVIGDISYSGIKFAGSVIPVYDRYVCLVVEDLIEKNLAIFEAALPAVDPAQLQEVGDQGAGMLTSARQRLLTRASNVKARLQGVEEGGQSNVGAAGVTRVNISGRTKSKVDEILKKQPKPEPTPIWGWLENFAKTNPALSNVTSFFAGAFFSAAVTILIDVVTH